MSPATVPRRSSSIRVRTIPHVRRPGFGVRRPTGRAARSASRRRTVSCIGTGRGGDAPALSRTPPSPVRGDTRPSSGGAGPRGPAIGRRSPGTGRELAGGARRPVPGDRRSISGTRGPAPPELGRISPGTGDGRVLEGTGASPPRPVPVHEAIGRRLGDRAALPVGRRTRTRRAGRAVSFAPDGRRASRNRCRAHARRTGRPGTAGSDPLDRVPGLRTPTSSGLGGGDGGDHGGGGALGCPPHRAPHRRAPSRLRADTG